MPLSAAKDDRDTLRLFERIAKTDDGKRLIDFIQKSFGETAEDVIHRTAPHEIYMQHGFMQCCSELIFMFKTASGQLARTGDTGPLAPYTGLPP